MSPQMTCFKSLNGSICKEVGGRTQASRRLPNLIKTPTCLCKEVGDYLVKYTNFAATIFLNSEW